jgi:hypothetical protein
MMAALVAKNDPRRNKDATIVGVNCARRRATLFFNRRVG